MTNKPTAGYTLNDAELMYRAFPDSFHLPDAGEVGPGSFVKLAFQIPQWDGDTEQPRGERMWVLVEKVNGNDMSGKLFNSPMEFDPSALKQGDTVEFQRRHIYQVQ